MHSPLHRRARAFGHQLAPPRLAPAVAAHRGVRARVASALAAAALVLAAPAAAQQCGGDFGAFVDDLRQEALSRGHAPATVAGFFDGVRYDQRTINADRSQGIFQTPFVDFARRLISANRIQNGRANAQRHDAIFDVAEREFGIPRGILLAFWAFETDFGQVQGDYNTVNSLVTLAHDCRRPGLFRPQVFAAIELFAQGGLDPATTTGAWAGEIGMVQMLPGDIIERGIDGDGDGRVSLKTSIPDALLSGANMLRGLGWRAGEPWLVEVTVPAGFDWAQSGLDTTRPARDWAALGVTARQGPIPSGGLPTSLIAPQGRNGPAFLAYPNYSVLFEWNRSFVYVTTAAYFATRLEGAPVFDAGNPDAGLSQPQMMRLQEALVARGYDVGGVDGILGRRTREAVQDMQTQLGLPADGWPTPGLLRAL